MKTKYLTISVLFLIISIVCTIACENYTGSNSNGFFSANRIYFIKLAERTENYGTLCYIMENSETVHTVTDKYMTSFSINRDKTKVVFAEFIPGYSGSYIAFMNINGSSYQQNYIDGSNPSFNAEGNLIYFDHDGILFSMNIDGTDKKQIDIPGVTGAKRFPRISPDGNTLAFCQFSPGSNWYSDNIVFLYTYDLTTGHVTKLNDNSIPASFLNWSPDGETIAFSTTTGVTPPIYELWSVKANGSEQPIKLTNSDHPSSGACGFPGYMDNDYIFCGSSRNKKLYYYSDWDGNHYMYELAKVKSDGTSVDIILPGHSIRNPVWIFKW